MRIWICFGKLFWGTALVLGHCAVQAQDTNEVNRLRQQLDQLQSNFDLVVREQRAQIEALKQQITALQAQTNKSAVTSTDASSAAKSWSPTDPVRLGRGSAYADIGLVATFAAGGSTADDIEGGTQLGAHDPNQRGFTVQGVELNLQGAVDPYFRGNVNLLFSLDSGGESYLELEEAWLESVSLPGNLQVRAGQLMTEYGRVNTQHPHAWTFVDVPLVNARFLGPDGLRNPGARISWLMPTPFYSELFLSVQNSQGETAASFRGDAHAHGSSGEEALPFAYRHADNDRGLEHVGDLLFTPRYAVSFDLTDNQVLLFGTSAAFGPNSRGGAGAGDTTTQIYGVDLTWKWKSPRHHAGFPFVQFQTEALLMKYEAGAFDWDEDGNGLVSPGEIRDDSLGRPAALLGENLTDYGFYAQLSYGFRKGWVAGLRGDLVTSEEGDYERMDLSLDGAPLGRDPMRAQRWRLSPNLTWYPSEFSKLRLQYNYDNRSGIGEDHSVWLQFEFLLGAHAAHKF